MRKTGSVSSTNSEVEKILRRLQALCRRRPAGDERTVHSGRVPDDLATDDFRMLYLHAGEEELYRAALEALSEDLRLEYLNEREADGALWRFVCMCFRDRNRDEVQPFVSAHAREPMSLICYLPVEHLTLSDQIGLLGVRLLPIDRDEVPKPAHRFSLEPPTGCVAAVRVHGSSYGRMAKRAREGGCPGLRRT
jgi:hypothetical protein